MENITGPNGYANANGWSLLNNVWSSPNWAFEDGVWKQTNLNNLSDYQMTASPNLNDITSGTTFNWSFPENNLPWTAVRAYPDVTFGATPWGRGGSDPTHVFPVQVKDLKSLVVDQDVTYAGHTAGFDVAYDIWFTSVPEGAVSTVTNELMIWLHQGGVNTFGELIGTYADGNFTGKIYYDAATHYTAIVSDTDISASQIDVTKMIAQLHDMNIISDKEYLASIQLGAEVVEGKGSLTINNLDINVLKTDASGNDVSIHVTGEGVTTSVLPPVEVSPQIPDVSNLDKVFDADGKLIGYKSTHIDANKSIITESYDRDGHFTGAVGVSNNNPALVTTQHFDAQWHLTGSETIRIDANGSKITESYDKDGHFTGALGVSASEPNIIQHYDAQWHSSGTTTIFANGSSEFIHTDTNKSIITESFDKDGHLIGAIGVSNNNPNLVITEHFDSHWQVTGSEHVRIDENGSRITESYDKDGHFTGAIAVSANAPNITQHYDANWQSSGTTFVFANGTSEFIHTDANKSIITESFDKEGHFIGAVGVSNNNPNLVVTEHFDSKWQLTGSEHIRTDANGSKITESYDKNGHFTGAVGVNATDPDHVVTQHYDANWHSTGSYVSFTDINGVKVTQHFDAHEHLLGSEFTGTAHNDHIVGSSGNDIFTTTAGIDTFNGGSGADVFKFTSAGLDGVDKIENFDSNHDKLNIHDLLTGYDPHSSAVTDFVNITETSSGHSVLSVDHDGLGSTYHMTPVAAITSGTHLTDELLLVNKGTLVL